ncbi:MAG: hypothetical protein IJH31_07025 [Erysipelotrichaceae bacterium]|nr:hypothetical protein [Erysipelotrichaceae bacterium]
MFEKLKEGIKAANQSLKLQERQKDVAIVSEMLDVDVAIAKYGEKKEKA